jgi:hypothetical protein
MLPYGRLGVFSRHIMEMLTRRDRFFNKEFGLALNYQAGNQVATAVHGFGRHGGFWRLVKATMLQRVGALAEHWIPTIVMWLRLPHGLRWKNGLET